MRQPTPQSLRRCHDGTPQCRLNVRNLSVVCATRRHCVICAHLARARGSPSPSAKPRRQPLRRTRRERHDRDLWIVAHRRRDDAPVTDHDVRRAAEAKIHVDDAARGIGPHARGAQRVIRRQVEVRGHEAVPVEGGAPGRRLDLVEAVLSYPGALGAAGRGEAERAERVGGVDIKYSFVGNPDRCLSSCAAQSTGPNGNAGADGMASIIAHEAEEAATDPDLNAWYDRRGYENADKCAWTFGTTYTVGNGAQANVKLGSRDYLIQRNWVNASGGYCALSY